MRWAGLFFGLNYKHLPNGHLNGCINDTLLIRDCLLSLLGHGDIEMHHDSNDLQGTSYNGIMDNIFRLSLKAIKDKLDLVVIHYSGHGSQVRDTNGDEEDGMDEVICPSDYPSHGMLKDDIICYLLAGFPAYTKVLTIFDSCHSGTITDLPFRWFDHQLHVENHNRLQAKIISISGCMDQQVSLDSSTGGMLTTNISKLLRENKYLCKNIFEFLKALNNSLIKSGTPQRSVLSSSYDLRSDPLLLPVSVY